MADGQRQAPRALARLARKNPAAAVLVGAVLVVVLVWGAATGASSAATGAESPAAPSVSAPLADATELQEAEVVRVVDGDTLKVRLPDGAKETVRLVGMDTPESVAPEASRNCEEGVIASDYAKSLASPGQRVWLSRDVSDTDRYGRLLRYVWLERPDDPWNEGEIAGKMLNAILVQEGYAQVKRYPPDTTLHDLFARWGDEAAAAGKGVTRKWA